MEDRIQLYMSNFPDMTREKAIKMITSFDAHIEKRRLFCQERLLEIEAKQMEEKRKAKEVQSKTTKRK